MSQVKANRDPAISCYSVAAGSGMGTKIEFAIDPLASALLPNSVHGVDDWQFSQTGELKKLQSRNRLVEIDFRYSMDRALEKHNMETIKRTMQIHEDIFKHQVKELHRLYSVQKTLTAELKKQVKHNHATTSGRYHVFNFQNVSDHERSGSCSGETKQRGFDLERAAMPIMEGDQVQAGPSSPISNSNNKMMRLEGSDEESGVELTLSMGVSSSSKKTSNYRELDSSASFKSDSGPNTPMSSSSATFDHQEKKMPHWLLGLSINRS